MSIKLKIGWIDNNVIVEGVRIYKSSALFDVNTLPAVYAEITDGSIFYDDFDIVEGRTYFYMLSCFLGEREVFTECYDVTTSKGAAELEFVSGSLVKNGPPSPSSESSISANEPSQSTSDKILIAIVSSQAAIQTPPGWTLLSSKLNTFVFWRKGGSPGLLHIFRTQSGGTQLSVYMFLLKPSFEINTVECVSSLSSKSTTSADPTAPSPILTTALDKRGYEIMLGKPQYAHQAGSTGSVSNGYTLIATHMYPTKVGDPYHTDLILGGRSRAKGEQVGGGVITQINAYQPSILFMQTIQICAS